MKKISYEGLSIPSKILFQLLTALTIVGFVTLFKGVIPDYLLAPIVIAGIFFFILQGALVFGEMLNEALDDRVKERLKERDNNPVVNM